MTTTKTLTVSIIIPVYNEELTLDACLQAIARQTVMPTEVIVVDNNSTDGSMAIAKRYPFVKIIREKQQGFTYARNAGFNAATSDILGRIDSDARIAQDWVARVIDNFSDNQLDGLTGLGSAALLPRVKKPKVVVWSWLYFLWMRGIFRLPMLWGANMALRRSTWLDIKDQLIMDNQLVHEDQDMTLCILEAGGTIARDNLLRITTGGQTYHYFPKLLKYTLRNYSTKRQHANRPAYKQLKRSPPLLVLTVMWVFPGVILPIFFLVSFIFWPVDYVMKRVGFEKHWLD